MQIGCPNKFVLPSSSEETFLSSSFFTQQATKRQLPTPKQVREQGTLQQPPHTYPPPPVIFSELGLIVKYGRKTSISEGQCLWMIRACFGNKLPVPEVYGWRQDNEEAFIYMELIQGETLEMRWDQMSETERLSICDQLRPMAAALREIQQSPAESYIGGIGSSALQDVIFEGLTVGPFPTCSSFNDFFVQPRWNEPPAGPNLDDLDPMRPGLPDDPIVFTHGDLHRSNIMVTLKGQEPRVLAIIDWHQSGWYPAFWEYCKARWTVKPGDEWVSGYLPKLLTPRPEAYHSWNYFCLCHGA